MSGLFDEVVIARFIDASIRRKPMYFELDNPSLMSLFSYQAYSYAWLNGTLPTFATPEYALSSFEVTDEVIFNETWTGETVLYESDLHCAVAEVSALVADGQPFGFNISNGKDCYFPFIDDSLA